MSSNSTFAQKILASYEDLMDRDEKVVAFGLGINDPKGVFGTTLGLAEKFGRRRVFDIPTSENALTGVGVGLAIGGYKPILCHQRFDFALLSVDQLVNSAAKWHFMFGQQFTVPLTVRMIIGRGWGQGPTHSQCYHSWFEQVPGLKVVVPSRAETVASLFKQSVLDPNPVIFIEHRWLHGLESDSDRGVELAGGCEVLSRGQSVTVVAQSYQTILAQSAAKMLAEQGVACDLIDVFQLCEGARQVIRDSVRKTGRLLCLDISHSPCSISSEVVNDVAINCFNALLAPPIVLSKPDYPEPTSHGAIDGYYQSVFDIVAAAGHLCGAKVTEDSPREDIKLDVPGKWFTGPF